MNKDTTESEKQLELLWQRYMALPMDGAARRDFGALLLGCMRSWVAFPFGGITPERIVTSVEFSIKMAEQEAKL